MKPGLIASAVAAAAIVGITAIPAHAADPADVTVRGGSLSITDVTVGTFAARTYEGPVTVAATIDPFSVIDARGTGEGWNVTMQGTPVREWDPHLNGGAGGYVVGGETLPLSSLSLSALAVTAMGTASPAPSTFSASGLDNTTGGIKVISAARDTGMGTYAFTGAGKLSLSIPASAGADAYRSEITVTVVSGP